MTASADFDPHAALDPSRALVPATVKVNARLVRQGFWPKLKKLARRLPFAQDAVALWFAGRDPATPAASKALILAALAYFVVPTDVLPDWFAGLGFTDDAAVIAAALSLVKRSVKTGHRDAARKLLDRLADEA